MLLYVCPNCHKWQDMTLATAFANALISAGLAMKNLQPETHIQDSRSLVQCPNGCGEMTPVTSEQGLMIVPLVVTQEVSNG